MTGIWNLISMNQTCEGHDLGKLIRKWRRARTSAFLTVIVPKESEDALRAAIATVPGAKIQGGAKQ